MQVTIGRRVEKRYGVLFTCLTVRAVHLGLATFLDTSSMIMSLRRIMARQGKPSRIYSDNGTNFRGANEELKKAVSSLDKDEILKQTSAEKIEWHFIPPGSPHMGGCWERLITHVSDDPKDERSLTPNDFLGLIPGNVHVAHISPGTTSLFSEEDKLRKQWRYAQWLANQFWKRWIKEYLPSINRRAKWHRERPELKVGDLVLIWDVNAPRNQWRRERVTAIYPGRDGRV